MTRVICEPGVCGNTARVEVAIADAPSAEMGGRPMTVKILSKCKKVAEMADRLAHLDEGELSEWEPIKPRGEPKICTWAVQCRLCAACPIPTAILKAMEVEAGLAAAKPVHLYFETVN
jgi:hypothetical protein